MVLPATYADAKALFRRILSRFRGGRAHYQNLQSQLITLADVGHPITFFSREHLAGMVKPWALGDPREGVEPVMICKERGATRREPQLPVLVGDVESARDLVRRLGARGVAIADWRRYRGEFLDGPAEKLFVPGAEGHRTQLEAELIATFGPVGRANQGFLVARSSA